MFRQVRTLGVMGGTFDPIHYGHLVTAEAVRAEYGLDQVLFVPTGQPAHKPAGGYTEAKHRYMMTILATLTNPHFEVSRVDIERPGTTYTIDTLHDLSTLYGPDTQLYFITGADAILEILAWKNPEELLRLCTFVAATRPGYDLSRLEQQLGDLYRRHKDRIKVVEVPAMAISSTDIRQRVRLGRPIRYLVPETVAYYIYKNGLYGATQMIVDGNLQLQGDPPC
ncbi:MAG: nicotinate-nucleotide adenylyltransferase [Limnochordaceae bacterium]|nr:nicotinate-nucleotide adenylyltransferase [Limnochordaceae bacterium]